MGKAPRTLKSLALKSTNYAYWDISRRFPKLHWILFLTISVFFIYKLLDLDLNSARTGWSNPGMWVENKSKQSPTNSSLYASIFRSTIFIRLKETPQLANRKCYLCWSSMSPCDSRWDVCIFGQSLPRGCWPAMSAGFLPRWSVVSHASKWR